jgi:hypothetical protein
MRGAPVRSVQELAGHHEIGATQRYMHLSPVAAPGRMWFRFFCFRRTSGA